MVERGGELVLQLLARLHEPHEPLLFLSQLLHQRRRGHVLVQHSAIGSECGGLQPEESVDGVAMLFAQLLRQRSRVVEPNDGGVVAVVVALALPLLRDLGPAHRDRKENVCFDDGQHLTEPSYLDGESQDIDCYR